MLVSRAAFSQNLSQSELCFATHLVGLLFCVQKDHLPEAADANTTKSAANLVILVMIFGFLLLLYSTGRSAQVPNNEQSLR